jgi:hypothetical protein
MSDIQKLLDAELTDFVLEHFPTPLAIAYQRLVQSETWHDCFYRTLALFDYGLRSLTLIYVRHYLLQDSGGKFNHHGLNHALSKFNVPTLGAWLEVLITSMDAYKDQKEISLFPEWHAIYEDQEQGKKFRDACQKIIEVRNSILHRFVPDTEEAWMEASKKLLQNLQIILYLFKFIKKYRLIGITETRHNGAIGMEYKGVRPRPVALPPDSVHLQIDRLYFWYQAKPENRYYDIHPLMVSWPPDNESHDTAFYESRTETRIRYLATLLRNEIDVTEESILRELAEALDKIHLRRKGGRRKSKKITWGLWKEITSEITQLQTEAIRAKYDPRVYLHRMAVKSMVGNFLTSDSTVLLLLGKSGVGKSNFLLSLLEDYSSKQDTAVLMLDAARLPVQDRLDITLTKMIREVANLPDDLMNSLEKDIWGELSEFANNKQFILIIDAINENDKARELLAQIDHLIGGVKRPWLKIIISSRPQTWQIIQRGMRLAENCYFHSSQLTGLGIELEGFSFTEHGAELKDFTGDELQKVFKKYQEVWNLQSSYSDLSLELKRQLRDPLALKLIAETYKNRDIPSHIDPSDLYDSYIEYLIKENRLQIQDIKSFLEQDLMPLMINENHFSNEITAEQVAETTLTGGRPLRDLIFDTSMLGSDSRVNSSFTRLTDTEFLVKQGGELNFTIRFKYERFYDYYAGKKLKTMANKKNEGALDAYLRFFDSLPKSPYLWGAIQQALVQEAIAGYSDLLILLAKSENQLVTDFIFNVIIDFHRSKPSEARAIAESMYQETGVKLKKLAVQISGAIGETNILNDAGNSKTPILRNQAVQSAYYLWRSDTNLGWIVLENWSNKAVGHFGIPNIKLLESTLGLSMLILTDQSNAGVSGDSIYRNPEVLNVLQKTWKGIIEKLLFINKEGNITNKTRILWSTFILSAIIKFTIGIATGASVVTSRQRGSVIPLMREYFKKPTKERNILDELIAEHSVTPSGIEPVEDLLYRAFKNNEPIPILPSLSLIIVRCDKNDVHKDIEVIYRLFNRLFNPDQPSMAIAQLVFTTAGVLQRSKNKIKAETWAIYTEIQRKYMDAGGLYYLPNQPKYEAGYIDAYTLIDIQKMNNTNPTLFSEYFSRAINGEPAPSIPGLLGEAASLAVVGKQPRTALSAMQPLIHHKDKDVQELFSKVLARIRLYYPDLIEDYLIESNAPPELTMKVQTTVVRENIWADFLISRIGGFLSEVLFVSEFREVFLLAFKNASTAKSLEEWLIKVLRLIVNYIYGKNII